ncbi:hypothetical protein EV356DRAFT_497351 [Viridothelium virens]|uniref:Uncharacterized protein n=1 Tax=Viridothelium virens TaxID=1048519 RepID=A0A6A6HGT5_VIRVR|nr:hypothetical protein EV356DRAFT_497351 [Viridothelium virens]
MDEPSTIAALAALHRIAHEPTGSRENLVKIARITLREVHAWARGPYDQKENDGYDQKDLSSLVTAAKTLCNNLGPSEAQWAKVVVTAHSKFTAICEHERFCANGHYLGKPSGGPVLSGYYALATSIKTIKEFQPSTSRILIPTWEAFLVVHRSPEYHTTVVQKKKIKSSGEHGGFQDSEFLTPDQMAIIVELAGKRFGGGESCCLGVREAGQDEDFTAYKLGDEKSQVTLWVCDTGEGKGPLWAGFERESPNAETDVLRSPPKGRSPS